MTIPVGIVTKSALVTRDIDILSRMAAKGLAKVALSVTTLDRRLARSHGAARLDADAAAGGDARCRGRHPGLGHGGAGHPRPQRPRDGAHPRFGAAAGAREAGYVILRLPLEVSPIFKDWLLRHYPDRYRHVMSLVRSMRGGKDYDSEWGKRMKGAGPYAWQIGRRFEMAARALGLNTERRSLRTDLFKCRRESRHGSWSFCSQTVIGLSSLQLNIRAP
jgi:DNA repair photolyase